MANVLFCLSYMDDAGIQAWTMELIQERIHLGDTVRVVKCARALPACHGLKLGSDLQICVRCESRTHYSLNQLGVRPEMVDEITSDPAADHVAFPEFDTVEALKAFTVDGINVGLGVSSTMVSALRDHGFDPREHSASLQVNLRAATRVLFFFRRYLEEKRPDVVYLFNGRFSESRPIIELCRVMGIPFRTYDAGTVLTRYQVFDDILPQDLSGGFRELIDRLWDAAPDPVRRDEIASDWFKHRREGRARPWSAEPVYVRSQERGVLPDRFDRQVTNIAVFNSSEDEFASIGDVTSYALYRDQNEAIRRVLAYFAGDDGFHIHLRVHPNLRGLDNTQTRTLLELQAPNLTIIPAESVVDTYALLNACDRVLTFGSTVGVEATFWGKPSVLLGRSYYAGIDAVHEARSFDEMAALLRSPSLAPKPVVGALKYGYWWAEWGAEVDSFMNVLEGADRGYDAWGGGYTKAMSALLRRRFPITYIPFYRRILSAIGNQSRRSFYGSAPAPVE